ncbi:transposase [Bradyrhizobium quebecense]|uniref:Transposase n=2 Tax=Bradyrhizobium quebecense TaxID=2748629 RepID=A0A939RKK2_9BRAD|nr:transposase [Bradyrhizobium quebecense]
MHAEEAASWDNRHERFEIKGINHQEAHSLDGTSIDMAEEYLPRLRRAGTGAHRHIAGAYLPRSAPRSTWREDNRRISNRGQVNGIAGGRRRAATLFPHALEQWNWLLKEL